MNDVVPRRLSEPPAINLRMFFRPNWICGQFLQHFILLAQYRWHRIAELLLGD